MLPRRNWKKPDSSGHFELPQGATKPGRPFQFGLTASVNSPPSSRNKNLWCPKRFKGCFRSGARAIGLEGTSYFTNNATESRHLVWQDFWGNSLDHQPQIPPEVSHILSLLSNQLAGWTPRDSEGEKVFDASFQGLRYFQIFFRALSEGPARKIDLYP